MNSLLNEALNAGFQSETAAWIQTKARRGFELWFESPLSFDPEPYEGRSTD